MRLIRSEKTDEEYVEECRKRLGEWKRGRWAFVGFFTLLAAGYMWFFALDGMVEIVDQFELWFGISTAGVAVTFVVAFVFGLLVGVWYGMILEVSGVVGNEHRRDELLVKYFDEARESSNTAGDANANHDR